MATELSPNSDKLMRYLSVTETKKRLLIIDDLTKHLENNICQSNNAGQITDYVTSWIQSNNHKVTNCGLDTLKLLINEDFSLYMPDILSMLIGKFADTKAHQKSIQLIKNLFQKKLIKSKIFVHKIVPIFQHKNLIIKLNALQCIDLILNCDFERNDLRKLFFCTVDLWNSSHGSLEGKSMDLLVKMSQMLDQEVLSELQKKYSFIPKKLDVLMDKLGEVKSSVSTSKKNKLKATKKTLKRNSDFLIEGVIDEDIFEKAFEDTIKVAVFSMADAKDQLCKINDQIDQKLNWEARADALRKLRGILKSYANQEIIDLVKSMDNSFINSLKDLRSQVVKETCVTISFLSKKFGVKLEKFFRATYMQLLNLLMSSIKVMSSSGYVTICFLMRNVQSSGLITAVVQGLGSKSKDVRRGTCEFLEIIMEFWTESLLEKSMIVIKDGLKKGITDADSEARSSARVAFYHFRRRFPVVSEVILLDLDPYQRSLCLEVSVQKDEVLQDESLLELTKDEAEDFTTKKRTLQDVFLSGIRALSPGTSRKSISLCKRFSSSRRGCRLSTSSKTEDSLGTKIRRRLINSEEEPELRNFTLDNFIPSEEEVDQETSATSKNLRVLNSEQEHELKKFTFDSFVPLVTEGDDFWDEETTKNFITRLDKFKNPCELEKILLELQNLLKNRKISKELINVIKFLLNHIGDPENFMIFNVLNEVITEYSVELEQYLSLILTELLNISHRSTQRSLDIILELYPCCKLFITIFEYVQNLSTETPSLIVSICNFLTKLISKLGVHNWESLINTKLDESVIITFFEQIMKWLTESADDMKVPVENTVVALFNLDSSYFYEILDRFFEEYKAEVLDLVRNDSHDDYCVPIPRTVLKNLGNSSTEDKASKTKLTLKYLIKNINNDDYIRQNFRILLRALLYKLANTESPNKKVYILKILHELIRKDLIDCFNKFGELITLKMLQTVKDADGDVRYGAEICLERLGLLLSTEIIMRTLIPMIKSEHPVNVTAIKVLTVVIKNRDNIVANKYMKDVVPTLIEAYNDSDSTVRKYAVFCLVEFCSSLGQGKLEVYLNELDSYKLKLLNLYLSRVKK